jgi:hypothetical protein
MRNVWSNSDERIRSEERSRSTKFFTRNVWSFLKKKDYILVYSIVYKQIQEYDQIWKRNSPETTLEIKRTIQDDGNAGGKRSNGFWMDIRQGNA